MPRSIRAPALAILLLGAAPQQDGWDRDARRLAHLAVSRDGREGVRLERVAASGAMGDEGMRTVSVWLEAGRPYLIVGVCDDACGDLDLRVHDTLGRPAAADEDALPRPMVDVTPRRSGEHAVRASWSHAGRPSAATPSPCSRWTGDNRGRRVRSIQTRPPRETLARGTFFGVEVRR